MASSSSSSSSSRFATLTPDNQSAQKHLASLLDKHSVAAAEILTPSPPPNRTGRAAPSRPQLVFSFDTTRSGPNGGWIVGRLSSDVDLPVCLPGSRCFKGTRLFEIWIHLQSGAMMLQNQSDIPIIYLHGGQQNSDIELRHLDQHILHRTVNYLHIGPLHYMLEFSVEDEKAYAACRDEYMQRQYRDWNPPPPSLGLLPKPTHMLLGDIVIHKMIAKGAFGLVRVGVERQSGQVMACKTIYYEAHKSSEIQVIRNELDISRRIPARATGLVPMHSSWCDCGQSPPCLEPITEGVHFSMPYAPFTFRTAPWHEISIARKLVLFRQILEGLRNLHAMDIMHRDISPANLLIFSHQIMPLSAGICDFGKAKRGSMGREKALGPPAFTAPEVRSDEYTTAIDIFSLGLCFLATFREWKWSGPVTMTVHATTLRRLWSVEHRMPHRFAALLRSMLAWEPAERPTAEEALADEVWEQAAEALPSSPEEEGGETATETTETIGTTNTDSSGGSSGSGSSSGGAGAARWQRSGGPPPSGSEVAAESRDSSGPSSSSGSSEAGRRQRSGGPPPSGSEVAEASRDSSDRSDGRVKRIKAFHSRPLPSPPPA